MLTIREGNDLCTVIATVDASPDVTPGLAAHARMGLERFPDFPGFVGGALHVSRHQGRIVQYLQWTSESDYEACINDPTWDDLPSTASFLEAIDSGQARLDVQIFRVEVISEGRTGPADPR